jgi:hypothetical protein
MQKLSKVESLLKEFGEYANFDIEPTSDNDDEIFDVEYNDRVEEPHQIPQPVENNILYWDELFFDLHQPLYDGCKVTVAHYSQK